MRRLLTGSIDAIVDVITHLSSNKSFFAGIVAITIFWIAYNALAPHPFDDWTAGLPKLVFGYTIIFGLWEGAMKIVQAVQVKQERKARDLLQRTINDISDIAVEIRRIADGISDEQKRSRERDDEAAQRDLILIDLASELVTRLEALKGQNA